MPQINAIDAAIKKPQQKPRSSCCNRSWYVLHWL